MWVINSLPQNAYMLDDILTVRKYTVWIYKIKQRNSIGSVFVWAKCFAQGLCSPCQRSRNFGIFRGRRFVLCTKQYGRTNYAICLLFAKHGRWNRGYKSVPKYRNSFVPCAAFIPYRQQHFGRLIFCPRSPTDFYKQRYRPWQWDKSEKHCPVGHRRTETVICRGMRCSSDCRQGVLTGKPKGRIGPKKSDRDRRIIGH